MFTCIDYIMEFAVHGSKIVIHNTEINDFISHGLLVLTVTNNTAPVDYF